MIKSVLNFLKWFYLALGNTKGQRFRRFFLLILVGAVLIYFRPEIVGLISSAAPQP